LQPLPYQKHLPIEWHCPVHKRHTADYHLSRLLCLRVDRRKYLVLYCCRNRKILRNFSLESESGNEPNAHLSIRIDMENNTPELQENRSLSFATLVVNRSTILKQTVC